MRRVYTLSWRQRLGIVSPFLGLAIASPVLQLLRGRGQSALPGALFFLGLAALVALASRWTRTVLDGRGVHTGHYGVLWRTCPWEDVVGFEITPQRYARMVKVMTRSSGGIVLGAPLDGSGNRDPGFEEKFDEIVDYWRHGSRRDRIGAAETRAATSSGARRTVGAVGMLVGIPFFLLASNLANQTKDLRAHGTTLQAEVVADFGEGSYQLEMADDPSDPTFSARVVTSAVDRSRKRGDVILVRSLEFDRSDVTDEKILARWWHWPLTLAGTGFGLLVGGWSIATGPARKRLRP